jgi:hypothetical protein
MATTSKKTTWRDLLFGHVIAFVGCVLFPGFVTAVAPVSWVKFERTGERVTARAQVCLFFVVPYKTITVDPVEGIGDRFIAGTETRQQRSGQRDRITKSEDEAFLVIHGPDKTAEVPVTPHDIKSVTERTDAFLQDPQATELKLFVVANWKFSVIGGGLVSLLTVLYVVGVACSIFAAIFRGLRGGLRFAAGADLRDTEFQQSLSQSEPHASE